jgi:uncharacterized DUF497 family protein
MHMKYFAWNDEKNEQLRAERNISFEEVVTHIEQGAVLDILNHPNPAKYPGQRIFVVHMYNYAWLVPFVEDDRQVFLKTIIPSRKATKRYLRRTTDESEA